MSQRSHSRLVAGARIRSYLGIFALRNVQQMT